MTFAFSFHEYLLRMVSVPSKLTVQGLYYKTKLAFSYSFFFVYNSSHLPKFHEETRQ